MRKYLIAGLMMAVQLLAQTNVSGNGGGNWGVWTQTNSPYHIVGNVTVESGDTLIIEPGVEVDFTDTLYIRVYGTMLAQGTITDSIIFKHLTPGMKHFGIDIDQELVPQTVSKFEYCRIQDGTAANDSSGISPAVGYPYIRFGGGIFIMNSSPEIRHCVIQNNEAFYGGGISARYDCAPVIEQNIIRNNTALGQGAGIACYGNVGTEINRTIIKNNLIYDNSVNDPAHAYNFGGGGISLFRQTDVIVANNVIFNNYSAGKGGGVVLIPDQNTGAESTNVTITNTILWGNTQNREGGGLNQINITSLTSTYSLTVENSDVQGGYAGTGNIDADPLFLDSSNGNFHIAYNSPCIDAGASTNAPTTDFDENPSNQDGDGDLSPAYDIGAFELLSRSIAFTADGTGNYSVNTFETGASNSIANITVNGLSAGGSIQVVPVTKSMPLNAPIGSKAINRWYHVIEDGSVSYSSATLELYYSQPEFDISGLLAETNITLWKYENGAWINKAGLLTNTADGGSILVSGNSSLNGYWAFADVNDASLPVTMGNAIAAYDGKQVNFEWNTESEINNAGFELRKRVENSNDFYLLSNYRFSDVLSGMGTSNTGQTYHFSDKNVRDNEKIEYRLFSIDVDGNSEMVAAFTVVCEAKTVPDKFEISANYPNPFNPATKFNVEVSGPQIINFEVYNIQGQLINKREIRFNAAGIKVITFDGSPLPSGLYLYRFTDGSQSKLLKTGKMVLVK